MRKIGIIGIRGHNVIYSGFETFVKHLVNKFDSKKFFFVLYCRTLYQKQKVTAKNFTTIIVPTIQNKHLETILYSFCSHVHSLFQDLDIVLYLGVSNTLFIFSQKILNRKVIVNVDGFDWKRKRWFPFGPLYLKFCEKLTVLFSDVIICDSKIVFEYYKKNYRIKNLAYIPYGADVKGRPPADTLKHFKITPQKYFACVGRLVPENAVEDLILAFRQIKTEYKCVIIGDSTYEKSYKNFLLNLAKNDTRFVFTGFLRGKAYEEVCSNAYAYIETKSVGGTHPSLLEAMAFGNCVVAKDIRENVEVVGNCGLYYDKKIKYKDLRNKLVYLLNHPKIVKKYGLLAKKRVIKMYNWRKVILEYNNLFLNH